jgi:transposase
MSFNSKANHKNPLSHVEHYLGCDVAKHKLDVSLIDLAGNELQHGLIGNTPEAITRLLMQLADEYGNDTIACVIEATSIYHLLLAETSHALGVPCIVYNPIITKGGIKATVRGKKTDRSDALVIARMELRGEGSLYVPEAHKATKHYARSCQKLSILHSSFIQYKQHMSSLLKSDLTDESRELLEGVEGAIAKARQQLNAELTDSAATCSVFRLLQTIPGVGPYVAASVIGEIQDITRFHGAKQLIAYAGLDPKIIQSGKKLNSTGRLTKRGSSYLRRSLFISANIARQYDSQFKALYDKKRAEGKTYTEATCVVARKLLKVIRAVWLSGKPYSLPE